MEAKQAAQNVVDYENQTSAFIRRVQKEASNLDIDFTEIDEAQMNDELSPLPNRRKPSDRHSL